jgi:hypothetical protein
LKPAQANSSKEPILKKKRLKIDLPYDPAIPRHIPEVMFLGKWMELENIMLRKLSQD